MKYVNNISRLRADRGLTIDDLADKSGLSRGFVSLLANGHRQLTQKTAEKLADALRVTVSDLYDPDGAPPQHEDNATSETTLPVRYRAGGGVWVESNDHVDGPIELIEGVPLYAYRRAHQWYEKLEGDSMDKMFPDGTYLHVIDAFDIDYAPRHGDIVIVERQRDGGFLRERSAKQINIDSNGSIELWPRSANPRWQSPIALNDHPDDETVTVAIAGLVARAVIVL